MLVHQTHCSTSSLSVRETLYHLTVHLPKPLHRTIQRLITWQTAKPHTGQQPLFSLSPMTYLGLALVQILMGLSLSFLVIAYSPLAFPLLYYTYSLTVGGFRILEGTINHQGVHQNVFRSSFWNRLLVEMTSTMMFTQHYDGYIQDHIRSHHNRKIFNTADDPAFRFILKFGFVPSQPKSYYWQHLRKTLLSPSFYGLLLQERIMTNFWLAPLYRRLMSLAWLIILVAFTLYFQAGMTVLLILVVPLTIFHSISALLSGLTEHRWGYQNPSISKKMIYSRLTFGRFSGENPSCTSFLQSPLTWMRWFLKFFLIHLPVRLGVWVGEMPEHDFHHRHVYDPNWVNGIYARQQDIEAGCPNWPESYTECWGIVEALDEVFESLSQSSLRLNNEQ